MTPSLWAILGAMTGFVISIGAGLLAAGPLAPTTDPSTPAPSLGPSKGPCVGNLPSRGDRRRDLACAAGTATLFASLGMHHTWLLVPILPSLLVWAAIADVDARTRIIPNRANAAAAAAAALVVAAGTYVAGWHLTYIAVAAAVGLGVTYFVLALLPSGVGGGDLKLAPSLAAVCGSVAASAPVTALVLAFAGTAIYGIAGLAHAKVTGTRISSAVRIPHGPFMILGAVVAIIIS